ncbi:hypothetical protein HYV11_03270 [Candidatus Dependentiae bacterium]|nr:hypothetical protein [Candidatus Dependentiae bacterium]
MKKQSLFLASIISINIISCINGSEKQQRGLTFTKNTKPVAPLTTEAEAKFSDMFIEGEEPQILKTLTPPSAPEILIPKSSPAPNQPGFLGGLFSFWSNGPTTSTPPLVMPNESKKQTTLSGQLKEQAIMLLALRKKQIESLKKLNDEQHQEYLEKFHTLSTTATDLSSASDQFIPQLVQETEGVLYTIQKEEELAIKDLLTTGLTIVNDTKKERGKARVTARGFDQTQKKFRPESPAETIEGFAKRITTTKK